MPCQNERKICRNRYDWKIKENTIVFDISLGGKKFPYDSDFDISMNLIIIIIKKLTTERNIVFFSQE